MKNITVEEFSKIFFEELENAAWGDIDPYIFKQLSGLGESSWANPTDVKSMRSVLVRALRKLNEKA